VTRVRFRPVPGTDAKVFMAKGEGISRYLIMWPDGLIELHRIERDQPEPVAEALIHCPHCNGNIVLSVFGDGSVTVEAHSPEEDADAPT
jgi:hypothetical protein